MKIMLCQVNPTVGDLKGNLNILKTATLEAVQLNCDVAVFPELVTVGYPPRDLLYNQNLWDSHKKLVDNFHQFVKNIKDQITVIFGGLHQTDTGKYNAAFIVDKDKIRIIHKKLLPQYDVFDESRYFHSGIGEPYQMIPIATKDGIENCDVIICEDMWNFKGQCTSRLLPARYLEDPISSLKGDGPLFIINGSPYWENKIQNTSQLIQDISNSTNRTVVWVNQIGAHDDIVTGGYSQVCYPKKTLKTEQIRSGLYTAEYEKTEKDYFAESNLYEQNSSTISKCFAEDRLIVDTKKSGHTNSPHRLFGKEVEENDINLFYDYKAIKLNLIEYLRKTGFKNVVLGVSGGIDSALVATIAADALGPEYVTAIAMPSKFSSTGSVQDAEQLCNNLNIRDFRIVPIKAIHDSTKNALLSGGYQKFNNSLTDENIQPRCRMIVLFAISNEEGSLVLTTGNKSELSCGYSTLYGDQAGGISLIGDLFKTEVIKMCKMLNKYAERELIPVATIDKPPSAELRENQFDNQSLPEYDILDPILKDIIDNDLSVEQLIHKHKDPLLITKILKLYNRSEFKRSQYAPVCKLKLRSFGHGRRIPIAANVTTI